MGLEVVPSSGGQTARAVGHTLLYRDYLTWCDRRLIAAAGSSRETQTGSRLVQTAAPGWHQRTIDPAATLSWVSPACAPSGNRLVAAAGPDHAPVGFGHQHRSLWMLRPDGRPIRRLTSPPAPGLSDEAPRFSRDGRWVLFVRTRLVAAGRTDVSRATLELVRANGTGGPVPIARFTSGDISYYDHYGWPQEIDWFSTRRHARPVPACRMRQLTLRRGHSMAGLGNAGEYLTFTNTSTRACRIGGWPTLVFSNPYGVVHHAIVKVSAQPTLGYTSPTRAVPFILEPHQRADAAFRRERRADQEPPVLQAVLSHGQGRTARPLRDQGPVGLDLLPRRLHARLLADRARPPCTQLRALSRMTCGPRFGPRIVSDS